MKKVTGLAFFILVVTLVEAQTPPRKKGAGTKPAVFKLSITDYNDKVHAIWAGQIIATLLGLPAEHTVASVKWIDSLPKKMLTRLLDDDWYYEMIAVKGFEKFGPDMTVAQLGEMWNQYHCGSWGSSFQARKLLEKGVQAPMTGHPLYNRFWFTIGPQFSADVYGALAPGMPNVAARMARQYGHVNGYAEAVDGAVFVATAISLGFTETDTKTIVRKAASVLDKASPYRQCLDMVIHLAEKGAGAKEVLKAVEDRYHIEYPATNNAVANGGIVATCLWFGEADFLKTVNLAAQSLDFTDADCNAANSIGVIMAMKGTAAIPKSMYTALGDRIKGDKMGPVVFNPPVDESITDLAIRTAKIGEQILVKAGASREGNSLVIPLQPIIPQPPELFKLADYTKTWDPAWELTGAGFAGPKGGTYLEMDSNVLVTYPRDEVRRLSLSRNFIITGRIGINLQLASEAGKVWELVVYVDDDKALTKVIESGAGADKWVDVALDLTPYKGSEVRLRLFQNVLVEGGAKTGGNAYWRKIIFK